MDDILQNWGLASVNMTPIDSPSKSTWDVGGQYILKRFANIDEAARGMQFSILLNNKSIPVARYIPMTDGQTISSDGLHCLMVKIPGKHPDFFEQPDLTYEMGRELARLHIALARIESKTPTFDSDFLTDWQNHIKSNIDGAVSDDLIERISKRFLNFYPKLPRQLIHRDVHCFNVLFDGGRLTGWLDFDLGQRNVRLFDIAYLLDGLLLGETNDPARVDIWRSLCRTLLSGYDEISPLTADEHDVLPVLMVVIEFLFAYFWGLRGNHEQRNIALNLAKWLCCEYRM